MANLNFIVNKLPNLNYCEVMKRLNKSEKHIKMKDSKEGKQIFGTFFIGIIKHNTSLKNNEIKDKKIKLFLQEVLENDKRGDEFQVILCGNYASELVKILDTSKGDIWCSFSNGLVSKYNGFQKDVLPLALKIEHSEKINPKVAVFYQSSQSSVSSVNNVSSVQSSVSSVNYAPLNDIIPSQLYRIFAVVSEVTKELVQLPVRKNRHAILIITDKSCFKPSAKRNDLLLHIFLNDPMENFSHKFYEGDIVRLNMYTELYQGDKLHGKIIHSHALVYFKSSEPNNEVTPLTSNDKYKLTDQDRRKVLELREWWVKLNEEQMLNNPKSTPRKKNINLDDSFVLEKCIMDVEEETTFTLYCQIVAIRQVSIAENTFILRVTDGTPSKVFTQMVSLTQATQDLMSQNDKAVFGETEVDISVIDLMDVTERVKTGDFVKLQNVSATKVGDMDEVPILDFIMKESNCCIFKLMENHNRVRLIKRRLKTGSVEQRDVESDSICELTKKLHELPRGTTSGENRDKTQNKRYVMNNNLASDSDEQEESHVPIKRKKRIGSPLSVSTPQQNPKLTNHNNIPPINAEENSEDPHLSDDGRITPLYDAINEDLITIMPLESPRLSVDVICNSERSEELDQSKETCPIRRIKSFSLATTYCSPYIEVKGSHVSRSLNEMMNSCNVGDTWCSFVIPQHIYALSYNKKCSLCEPESLCIHNWIWSYCERCGLNMDTHALRNAYSTKVLATSDSLVCHNCHSNSSTESRERLDNGDEMNPDDCTVKPFVKLELIVEEKDRFFGVNLAGDSAKKFFGIEPSFKWIVGSPPENLIYKIFKLRCLPRKNYHPMVFKCLKSDGKKEIHVFESYFKLS